MESQISIRGVLRGLIFMVLVILIGTAWFTLVEGYKVVDGLYMTIITVSTVGFREVHPLDASGRVFVVFLIVGGLTVLTYTLGSLGRVIVEGTIEQYVGRRKMVNEIAKLQGHCIICGYGRMGHILCEELERENVRFVAIERDAEVAAEMEERGFLVVHGDATEDAVLAQAGVTKAKSLVALVTKNVDNLYVTLSAREMSRGVNDDLYILARATDASAGEKIKRAGANRVISPYFIGGMRIVQALLRPSVYDFVDIATQRSDMELMFEEISLDGASMLHNVALKDSGIRQNYDIIIIGIKKPSGEMVFNPGPEELLTRGDILIAMGNRDQLDKLCGSINAAS